MITKIPHPTHYYHRFDGKEVACRIIAREYTVSPHDENGHEAGTKGSIVDNGTISLFIAHDKLFEIQE